MRLDHLLSKEHLPTPPEMSGCVCGQRPFVSVCGTRLLMGGTLTATSHPVSSSVERPRGYIGALLGPERTRECFVSDDDLRKFSACGWVPVGVVVCCLRTAQWTRASLLVSVYERTVDVLAPGADEGRGRLRYASGSCQPSCDPRISEWGNPARVMSCYPHLNI